MNKGLDLVGRQIGAYRVDALIGAGGYSRVYSGTDDNVGRKAAIKVLLPAQGDDGYSETVIKRFEREARIVANLRDPHSVQMYEYGQTDDGMLYMIFEFIEGDTLEEVRRRDGALPALRVVKILEQVLLSLEEAHAMGLVHRDIKPANIMVFEHIGRKDQVKVLDFGVGKMVGTDSGGAEITKTGVLIGTPRYMAPEQWSSDGEITPQTDIYSLGLVIYGLLTGEKAIKGTEPVHIMKEHIDDTPIELPVGLDIPSGLRRVVNTMMAKDRDRRYDSAKEVLEDLTRLKPEGTRSDTLESDEHQLAKQAAELTAEVAERPSAEGVDTGPGINEGVGEQTSSDGKRKLVMLALIVVGCAAGLVGIYVAFSGGDPQPAEVVETEPVFDKEQGASEGTSAEKAPDLGEKPGVAVTENAASDRAAAEDKQDGKVVEAADEDGRPGAESEDGDADTEAADEVAEADKTSGEDEEKEDQDEVATRRQEPRERPAARKKKTRSPEPREDSSSSNSSKDEGSGSGGGGLILYPADDE